MQDPPCKVRGRGKDMDKVIGLLGTRDKDKGTGSWRNRDKAGIEI